MRVVVINGTSIESIEEAHLQIQKNFRFPDYYGKNLDALYDLLSTEDRRTRILFFDTKGLVKKLGKRGEMLLHTFEEAVMENQKLYFLRIEK